MARVNERVVGEELELIEEVAQARAVVVLDVRGGRSDVRGGRAAHARIGVDADYERGRGPPGAQSRRSAREFAPKGASGGGRGQQAGCVSRDDGDRLVAAQSSGDGHDARGDGRGHDDLSVDALLDPYLGAVRAVVGACDVHVVHRTSTDLVVGGAALLDAHDVQAVRVELALEQLGAPERVEALSGRHRIIIFRYIERAHIRGSDLQHSALGAVAIQRGGRGALSRGVRCALVALSDGGSGPRGGSGGRQRQG